jgi:hypothetical protein
MKDNAQHRTLIPHFTTVVIGVLAVGSMASTQIYGRYDKINLSGGRRNDIVAVRFGWPAPFLWRAQQSHLVWPDDYIVDVEKQKLAVTASKSLAFYPAVLTFDLAMSIAIVFGIVYAVERFCRAHKLGLQFSLVSILAIAAWIASLFGAERWSDAPSSLEYLIEVLQDLRYVFIGIAWFGWMSIVVAMLNHLSAKGSDLDRKGST